MLEAYKKQNLNCYHHKVKKTTWRENNNSLKNHHLYFFLYILMPVSPRLPPCYMQLGRTESNWFFMHIARECLPVISMFRFSYIWTASYSQTWWCHMPNILCRWTCRHKKVCNVAKRNKGQAIICCESPQFLLCSNIF